MVRLECRDSVMFGHTLRVGAMGGRVHFVRGIGCCVLVEFVIGLLLQLFVDVYFHLSLFPLLSFLLLNSYTLLVH